MRDGSRHNPDSPHGTPRIGRIPEALIDAVIDGEVDERARREILAAARRNPQQRQELQETTEILTALRTPVASPDFSASVVAEAHRRRNFIPARVQRLVSRSRLAVAASLLLVLLSYVGASRVWPDTAIFNTAPAPLAQVNRSVAQDVQRVAETYSQARVPLPTAGSLFRVSVSPSPADPAVNTVAFNADRTGFYTFPSHPESAERTRHSEDFTPTTCFVGSSASTQPQPRDFTSDSKHP